MKKEYKVTVVESDKTPEEKARHMEMLAEILTEKKLLAMARQKVHRQYPQATIEQILQAEAMGVSVATLL